MSDIEIRKATRRDIPLITSSWLKSFRDGLFSRGIPNNIYYYNHHKILEELIPRSTVLVSCNGEDSDQILGWCCYEVVDTAVVLHYLYVKHPFRGFRVAESLVGSILSKEQPPAVMYTHSTRAASKIIKTKNLDWIYNPYLGFQSLPKGWEQE